MKRLMTAFAAGAAALAAGCSVTKVEYESNGKGEVSYRIYRNDHWLKTSASGLHGGMTDGGRFEFSADGVEASPSEEFNRAMQTYTSAFVQLAQVAAAAYNPSAKNAAAGASGLAPAASGRAGTDTQGATCEDGSCEDCPGGNCEDCTP